MLLLRPQYGQFCALLQQAASLKEVEVPALSLQALTLDYLNQVQSEEMRPDKSVIRLLLMSSDDESKSKEFKKTVGAVAREGLKNWAGKDLAVAKTTISARSEC